MSKLNIVVIGAGVSGLCGGKNAKSLGHTVTIYEQTSSIGGTWNYTDNVGKDEFGLNIHTSMYANLRTNTPKEIMPFQDFPFQHDFRESYIRSDDFLNYLHDYAHHFELNEMIKFNHHVIRVHPIEDTKWEVIVKNLKTNSYHKNIFDGIFICNGRLSHPNMPIPKIHGTDNFKGTQIHSHDFRRAERYTNKNVLLIGYGPSGIDLAFMLSEVTNHLYISHHNSNTICPEKSDKKPAIRELTADGVIFTNGEEHKIDDIIYCTGYKVSFPFLSVDCGISVEDNIISPLYKQCLNINYPTMGIIGITYMGTNTVNNQIQYVLNVLSGEIHLPSKEIMKTDSDYHVNFRRTLPNRSKEVEGVAPYLEYYKQLVGEADLGNVPSVYLQLYEDSLERRKTHPGEFRNDVYRIIDNLHFERNKLNE